MGQSMMFIGSILLVSLVFVSWGIIVNDFEENYIDTGISPASPVNSTFKGLLDESGNIADEVGTLEEPLRSFGQGEDSGFKLFQDTLAIAKVFVLFPGMMLNIFIIAQRQLLQLGLIVGIPPAILGIAIAGLVTFVIIMLINSIRRYEA